MIDQIPLQQQQQIQQRQKAQLKKSIHIYKQKIFIGPFIIPSNNKIQTLITNAQSKYFDVNKRQLTQNIESDYNLLTLKQNSSELQQLKNTLNNIKQDLCTYIYMKGHIMKFYQSLQKQNKNLLKRIKQKQLSQESQQKTKKQQKSLSAELNNITEQKQKGPYDQHISLSLELNSNLNSSAQKQILVTDAYQNNQIKNTILSLEKQISDLTRQNIQLKNTIVYYEARLQFIAQGLKKMEQQKQKEKLQNQNKKLKK